VLTYKVGEESHIASTNQEKGCALTRNFFPVKLHSDESLLGHEYPKACSRTGKVTREQIRKQLKKLKPFKAPGPNDIPNIVLTKCADKIVDSLLYIYQAMLEDGIMYKPWKEFTTVVLRKPGKSSYSTPKAFRPIALLNTMWKVITVIVANHITYYMEKHQLLPANHFGGRPRCTTSDAIHVLTNEIKAAWRKQEVVSVLFLDIEGAFLNANPTRLVHNLRKRRLPKKYANFVHNMLAGRSTVLKFDGFTSEHTIIDNSIGQGDLLSMVLYQYYNADLLDIPDCKGESTVAYVDDAFMLASGKNFQLAHRKLRILMEKQRGVTNWSTTHSSPLEYSKLTLINFASRHKKTDNPLLVLTHRTIEPTDSTKYLGVIVDRHLNWKAQQSYTVEKGTKWAAQIWRLARPSWGLTPKHAKRLFISVALPKILYALDVWCIPSDDPVLGPKANGSSKVTKQISSIQRAGALAILGGLRTSPTDVLDAYAHLLPAPLLIRKACYRAYVHMATLPPQHPLFKPVNWKTTRTTQKHHGPLQNLARLYETEARSFEKILSVYRDPSSTGVLPFCINTAENKENSAREFENAEEELQVYSDGSAQGSKVGAAAILIRKDAPDRTLHFHLGSDAKHTVHEAELVGMLLALHLIATEKCNNLPSLIAVDNQAVLKAYNSDMRHPGHNVARKFLSLAKRMQKCRGKRKFKLMLRWSAGHCGIEGNKKADREAKRAAYSSSSTAKLLPTFLRKPLPINPATAKRAYNKSLSSKWKVDWEQSPRGMKMKTLDNTTPSVKFLKTISNPKLSHEVASRITQLRMQHAPLNSYLYRFKRVDSANCPACGAIDKDIAHFLLFCPNYAHERWTLGRHACRRKKTLALKSLLGDPDFTVPLSSYIDSTKRFKQNSSEHTQP